MKNKHKKILIWAVIFIIVFYAALNAAIIFLGKAIIQAQIEKNLKAKTTIGSINVSLPLSVSMHNLDVSGLFKADYISVSPSILGFLAGKIVLNELKLINPEITLNKSKNGELNLPKFESTGKLPEILLAGLKVKNGKFVFVDNSIGPDGYRTAINSINIKVSKISFPPTSLYTKFNISGLLGESKLNPLGQINSSGWIDFKPKDMQGKIELSNVDLTYLAPYYQRFLLTKKLLSVKLEFTSQLEAKNNDLSAKCHVEISNVVYDTPPESENQPQDLIPKALDIFANTSGNMVFDFNINTKLDSPRIDLIGLRGNIAEAAAQNVINKPPSEIISDVKETVEQFKDFGKSLKEIFKKQKEEGKQQDQNQQQ